MKHFLLLLVFIACSVKIDAQTICIYTNYQLTGIGNPAVANAWISSDPSIASVDANGLVTGNAAGTCTVTYTDEFNVSTDFTITVEGELNTIPFLVSAPGTDQQSLDFDQIIANDYYYQPLVDIVYQVNPGVTISLDPTSVLPLGVTVTIVGNTLTISGTPYTDNQLSSAAVFSYKVIGTGINSCSNPLPGFPNSNFNSIQGTITLNPPCVNTITGGGSEWGRCIGYPFSFSFTIGGNATGVIVTGGTGNVSISGNQVTISGFYQMLGETYTVTTTGGNCIQNTAFCSYTVQHYPSLNSGNSNLNQTICLGEEIEDLHFYGYPTIFISSVPSGLNISSFQFDVFLSGAPTEAGVFNYVIEQYPEACGYHVGSISGTITVLPVPIAPVISNSGSNTLCQGQSIILTASPSDNYLWSTGETTQSISVSSVGDYFVSTSNGICAATSDTISIIAGNTITPSVLIEATDQSTLFCSGQAKTFTALPSNGGFSPAYRWYVNGNVVTGAVDSFFIANQLAANDIVSCELLTNESCISPNLVTSNHLLMTMAVTPSIAVGVVNNISSCENEDGSIEVLGNGSGVLSWSGTTSGSLSVDLPVTVSDLSPGTYDLVFTDVCPSNLISASIVAPVPPDVPFISGNSLLTFCEGDSVQLTSSLSSGFTWSSGETTQSIMVFASGDYYVSQTVNGCTITSNTITVLVNPAPQTATISALGETNFCQGDSVTLTCNLPSGIFWPTGDTSQTISVSSGGNYFVTSSLGTCSSQSNSILIDILQLPVIVLGGITSPSACGTSDAQLEVLGSGVGTLSWTGEASGSITGFLPMNIQNLSAGEYELVFSNECNSNILSVSITNPGLPAAPLITAQDPTTICEGESIILTSSATVGNNWSTGETSQSIVVSATGGYYVSISDDPNCLVTSNIISVVVNPIPAAPVIVPLSPTTFCSGGYVQLFSTSFSGNVWNTNESTQIITIASSGTYSVSVNENGCTSVPSEPVSVIVNPMPVVPTISVSGPLTFCEGESLILTSDINTGIQWSNGAMSPSIFVTTSGLYSLTSTLNGCSSISDVLSVIVNPIPAPSLNLVETICDTASNFSLDQGLPVGGIYTIDGINAASFSPSTSGIGEHLIAYSLTENGCTGSISTTLTVIDCSTEVGLTEYELDIQLFPNPTNGLIEITGLVETEISSIEVYDQVGKLVANAQQTNKIDLSAYVNGMYHLLIKGKSFESKQKVQLLK